MTRESQTEAVFSRVRLLTTAEVLAVTRGVGELRLSREAFLRFVAMGVAPARVLRRGGEPLWDASEIQGWAEARLQPLLEGEVRDQLRLARRGRRPSRVPELVSLSLDTDLPTHEAVVAAEVAIGERVRGLLQIRTRLRECVESLSGELKDVRESAPRRWWSRRAEPTVAERQIRLVEALADVERRISEAEADALTCRAWLYELLAWAQGELGARVHRVLEDGQLAREESARSVAIGSLTHYPTASAFVEEDPRRESWASAFAYDQIDIGGSDHGVLWRCDATEEALASGLRPRGTWRVSWLEETQELYAFERSSGTVVLIGTTPNVELIQMCEWMAPLERQMNERNSLGVVIAAFREQVRSEFAAFRAFNSSD